MDFEPGREAWQYKECRAEKSGLIFTGPTLERLFFL